ncbi:hypothetical protein [Synechococcus sp. PCC 6312]|uniref:hypothetical protein n=1 Tax=Synechococcus sp. (strain ATCC 27167 / PCC 6312) TaxID=195253 RepID=UPI00029F16B4|nr:hypothetical protein [Synechococcus sp. PCC 6312]AFY61952.1 hypothetical protein Syn6312_2888 [Synechococcus sp. PCC 6312]
MEVGEIVSAEVPSESVKDGWHKITGTKIVTGEITKVKNDLIWIESEGQKYCVTEGECWKPGHVKQG